MDHSIFRRALAGLCALCLVLGVALPGVAQAQAHAATLGVRYAFLAATASSTVEK